MTRVGRPLKVSPDERASTLATPLRPPREPVRVSAGEQQRFWDEYYGELAAVELADASDIDSFHAIYAHYRRFSHAEQFFQNLIGPLRGKTVVTIGGGIDKIALYLARRGNDVVSVDISAEATKQTELLAAKLGLAGRLTVRRANWELAKFEDEFDVAVFHDSLHHMDCELAIQKAHRALRDHGVLLAMEPICLPGLLREIHERFPFRPGPYVDGGEIELTPREFDTIEELFPGADVHYFEMLSRESVAYFLARFWRGTLLRALSAFDATLLNRLPFLRPLSSYAIVRAIKTPLSC